MENILNRHTVKFFIAIICILLLAVPLVPASRAVAPSTEASGMVELKPGKAVEIPSDQVQNIQGISSQSISGKRAGAQYYRASGPVKVPQSLVSGVSATMRPGPSIVPESKKRITCIYLDTDAWYMETGTYSYYGGTLCYRH